MTFAIYPATTGLDPRHARRFAVRRLVVPQPGETPTPVVPEPGPVIPEPDPVPPEPAPDPDPPTPAPGPHPDPEPGRAVAGRASEEE